MVTSLAGVPVAAESASTWSLVFAGFDQASEGIREALCTLGNGYFATRAAASWAVADGVHYPGTYLAGGYNRLRTNVAGRVVTSPVRWVNTARYSEPDWAPERTNAYGGDVAPATAFHVAPPSRLTCHCTSGSGSPLVCARRRASAP